MVTAVELALSRRRRGRRGVKLTVSGIAALERSIMETIAYGDKVKFSHRFLRKTEWRPAETASGRSYNEIWKTWEKFQFGGEGLFLGTRTLKNGTRYWMDEAGYIFEPKEHFQAALISPGPRTNPIYVPLACCQPVN